MLDVQAVIGYLESHGDTRVYWRILGEHNITRERLASYERKITAEPYMVQTNVGDLINDFRAYLSILKDVHDALDIKVRLSVRSIRYAGLLHVSLSLLCFVHKEEELPVRSTLAGESDRKGQVNPVALRLSSASIPHRPRHFS